MLTGASGTMFCGETSSSPAAATTTTRRSRPTARGSRSTARRCTPTTRPTPRCSWSPTGGRQRRRSHRRQRRRRQLVAQVRAVRADLPGQGDLLAHLLVAPRLRPAPAAGGQDAGHADRADLDGRRLARSRRRRRRRLSRVLAAVPGHDDGQPHRAVDREGRARTVHADRSVAVHAGRDLQRQRLRPDGPGSARQRPPAPNERIARADLRSLHGRWRRARAPARDDVPVGDAAALLSGRRAARLLPPRRRHPARRLLHHSPAARRAAARGRRGVAVAPPVPARGASAPRTAAARGRPVGDRAPRRAAQPAGDARGGGGTAAGERGAAACRPRRRYSDGPPADRDASGRWAGRSRRPATSFTTTVRDAVPTIAQRAGQLATTLGSFLVDFGTALFLLFTIALYYFLVDGRPSERAIRLVPIDAAPHPRLPRPLPRGEHGGADGQRRHLGDPRRALRGSATGSSASPRRWLWGVLTAVASFIPPSAPRWSGCRSASASSISSAGCVASGCFTYCAIIVGGSDNVAAPS